MAYFQPSRLRRIRSLALLISLILFIHRFHASTKPSDSQTSTHTHRKPDKKRASNGINNDTSTLLSSYHYIIVGGGQSGLTVANRLSEDPKSTVLVIEYGYLYHDDPLIGRPWQPFDPANNIFHNPKLMYNFSSTPQAGLNNRTSVVSAAATVGGGSTVYGRFMTRGGTEDYDAWVLLGNERWGWDGLLPYFRKSVTFTPPGRVLMEEYNATCDERAAYGGHGPIQLSNPEWAWPGQKVQMNGWKEMGVEQSSEGAGGNAVGTFWVSRAQDPQSQTRSYAVTGHLGPAMGRGNFDLLPGYRVNQIMFDETNRAEGVLIQKRGGSSQSVISAKREVILAAGGIHTPAIMQRSGVGPRKVLEEAGIDVKADLPGVGMNLQDHPAAGLAYGFDTDFPLNPGSYNKAQADDEYKRARSGPHAGGHNAVAFLSADSFYPNSSRLAQSVQHDDHHQFRPPIYEADPTLFAGYQAQLDILTRSYASNKSTLIPSSAPQ